MTDIQTSPTERSPELASPELGYAGYCGLFPEWGGIITRQVDMAYYDQSIQDPAFLSIPIRGVDVPVMSPVSKSQLVDGKYFEGREEFSGRDIFFINFPSGLDDSEITDVAGKVRTVVEAIRSSGESDSGSVFVFDYGGEGDPDSIDPGYSRLVTESLGVNVDDINEIGRQRYFAGKLINPSETSVVEGLSDKSLAESFDEVKQLDKPDLPGELIDYMERTSAVTGDKIDDDMIETAWKMYVSEFSSFSEETPSKEMLDREEFSRILKDPATTAFYLQEGEEIVSMCVMSSNLDLFDWLNTTNISDKYPEESQAGNIFEFPFIFTKLEMQGVHNMINLVSVVTSVLRHRGDEIVAVFDCCGKTREMVPRIVEAAVDRVGSTMEGLTSDNRETTPLATQVYCYV